MASNPSPASRRRRKAKSTFSALIHQDVSSNIHNSSNSSAFPPEKSINLTAFQLPSLSYSALLSSTSQINDFLGNYGRFHGYNENSNDFQSFSALLHFVQSCVQQIHIENQAIIHKLCTNLANSLSHSLCNTVPANLNNNLINNSRNSENANGRVKSQLIEDGVVFVQESVIRQVLQQYNLYNAKIEQ
jgi:hypothetical protein